MSRYEYKPLSRDGHSHRYIVLLPGLPGEEIEVEMFHSSSGRQPVYEALSYTWGSPEPTNEILIRHISMDDLDHLLPGKKLGAPEEQQFNNTSRHVLPISRNLAIALPYLRLPKESRILWIDAICINQDDISERGYEVGKMNTIYSKANQVVVWLGEESEDSTFAVESLKSLAAGLVITNNGRGWMKLHPKPYSEVERLGRNPELLKSKMPSWIAIANLLARPWFSRLWVFQEIILAVAGSIMVGHDIIPWEEFRTGALFLVTRSGLTITNNLTRKPAEAIMHLLTPNFVLENYDIMDYIMLISTTKCYDPRDRIFGLLGLLSFEKALGITADYTKSPKQVYTELFSRYIKHEETLISLQLCKFKDFESPFKLPSWVPDISIPNPTYTFELHASAGARPKSIYDESSSTLRIYGRLTCTINFISKTAPAIDTASSTLEICHEWAASLDMKSKYVDGSTTFEAFAALLLCGIIVGNKIQTPENSDRTLADLQEMLTESILEGEKSSNFRRFMVDIGHFIKGRTFFTTAEGYIGLGGADICLGDQVVVALGAQAPLVVRAVPEERGYYKIGGACFVPGFMCGEDLLGSLDPDWHAMRLDKFGRNREIGYYHPKSSLATQMDPRAGPLLDGWKVIYDGDPETEDIEMNSEGLLKDRIFKNIRTGEKSSFDPRLTLDNLTKMGFDIWEFILA